MRNCIRETIVVALALSLAGVAGAAIDAGAVVRMRQANFDRLLALHKLIRNELRQAKPGGPDVSRATLAEIQLAQQLVAWFPPGSGPEARIRTAARREIWAEPLDFRAKAVALNGALGQLDAAARSGDPDRMRAQQRAVADACESCHQTYLSRF
jgi:cytochrome c556